MSGRRPPEERGAIAFAEKLLQLLDQGKRTATYKYAVLLGLLDLCLEKVTEQPPRTRPTSDSPQFAPGTVALDITHPLLGVAGFEVFRRGRIWVFGDTHPSRLDPFLPSPLDPLFRTAREGRRELKIALGSMALRLCTWHVMWLRLPDPVDLSNTS